MLSSPPREQGEPAGEEQVGACEAGKGERRSWRGRLCEELAGKGTVCPGMAEGPAWGMKADGAATGRRDEVVDEEGTGQQHGAGPGAVRPQGAAGSVQLSAAQYPVQGGWRSGLDPQTLCSRPSRHLRARATSPSVGAH